jgi:hypothetical protein
MLLKDFLAADFDCFIDQEAASKCKDSLSAVG